MVNPGSTRSKPALIKEVLQRFAESCNVRSCLLASAGQHLSNRGMAEKDPEGMAASNLEESGLQQDIAHWAEVLDRWVKGIDTRLGRNGGAQDVASPDGEGRSVDGSPWGPVDGEIDADHGES
jgi:hypothetical protein